MLCKTVLLEPDIFFFHKKKGLRIHALAFMNSGHLQETELLSGNGNREILSATCGQCRSSD